MLEQIQTVQPDWIYLNGALPPLTRDFLHLRQKDATIQKIPTLLAPHGNLSKYALAHHRFRKQTWLFYAKARGFYNDLIWHAASDRESDQVRSAFGAAAQIRVVPMAPRAEGTWSVGASLGTPVLDEEGWAAQRVGVVPSSTNNQQSTIKSQVPDHKSQLSGLKSPSASPLHLVYFGRLSPEKNLPFAFLLLKQFARTHPDRPVIYDLIGSGCDAYEAKLQKLAASLPATVQVNFVGQLSPEALQARLNQPSVVTAPQTPLLGEEGWAAQRVGVVPDSHQSLVINHQSSLASPAYHALLMPSLTENFSYTVLESLQAGIPVLISDQTPWRDLQSQGVGWDLSLEDPDRWLQALEDLVPLSSEIKHASNRRSDAIRQFASAWAESCQSKISQLFCADSNIGKRKCDDLKIY
jgi:glycosyltransferase involved in cell wall biosynthesis